MPNQKPKSCPFNPYKHKHHFVRHVITTVLLVVITFVGGLYLAGVGVFSPFGESVGESSNLLSSFDSVQDRQGGNIGDSVKKVAPKKGSYEDGYQAALDFAKKRMAEEGVIEGFEGPLTFLRATVKSVSGQNVVVEFKASELDIFQEGMISKTAIVPAEVGIEQHVDKPEEQIAKEYEAFEKAYQKYEANLMKNPELEGEGPEEPMTYTVVNLSAGDLEAGDNITIRTEADIRTSDSFEVVFARLVSRPVETVEPPEEPVASAELPAASDELPPMPEEFPSEPEVEPVEELDI